MRGGKKRYYDVGLEPRRDARGRLLGVAGYMREITSRKQMEERLRQAHDELEMRVEQRTSELQDAYGKLEAEINERKHTEQELKRVMTAISQSGDSVLIVDTDGIVLYANPAFFSMSGYSAGETLGRNVSSLKSHLSDDDLYETVRATVKNGRSWTGLIAGKKKSGSTYEVEATVSPVRDDEDRVTNYVTVGRDVTEKKKLERQLRQAQKMEAIGTLAGGIAHDFNNIIAAIIGFAEMAIDDTDENTQIRRFLEQILKSGIRGRDLVKQILSFSRGSDIERRPVQVSLIVKEALKLLRASIPATIEIQQDIDPDSGIVMADATEIHQVVINLVTNAAHAMRSKGGILKVAVCNTAGGVDEGSGPAALGPGRYLRLTVSDTGQGMDKGIMERIFDPFFTTKEKGEGTGLGLSVVHGIVQSHEGVITVRSKPGRGSTFEVYLPTIEEPCSSDEDLGTIPEGRESILLIDDEETLIEIGTEMLERLGYSVTATTNSIEALRIFKKRPHSFDLVITDQAMPRMSGLELAREMISVRDDIPIILCTGFSEAVSKEQVPNLGIREFLLKPLVRKEMAEAIRRVLDGAKVPVRTVRAGQIQGKE
ncbi:MAG: Blue-light-activated protein [Syntrophorhabdaceae bacterium PtaU1.Bin034]|nr:MAG: Blue-light-activated protein [Syntrophorhabdaceae bacterium PtaU1.Bin034]